MNTTRIDFNYSVTVLFIEEIRDDYISRCAIGFRAYNYNLYALKPINIFYSIRSR